MAVITDIKTQVKNPDKVSVFLDGRYSFALTINQLAEHKEVRTGAHITEDQIAGYKKLSKLTNQYLRLINLIYSRPRSEYEIRTKLRAKKIDNLDIDELINKLKVDQYLDDQKFATWWVTSRKSSRPISALKLRSELASKGIKSDLANSVLGENFSSEDELEALVKLIEKKKDKYPTEEKLMAFLAGKGFSYTRIKEVLTKSFDDDF